MMRLLPLVMLLLLLSACMPAAPRLQLPADCQAEHSAEQLLAGHWLLSDKVLRLRQTALLEIGSRQIPMEGFLRLDLKQQQARLLAMNEMGIVLFDLQLSLEGEQLRRAIPQLEKARGLAQGVAQSLRQIFLQPRPQTDDKLERRGPVQRFLRPQSPGELGFLFDCQGDLRETRKQGQGTDWRVVYNDYRPLGPLRLPGQIVLNDYRNRVKLSLWLKEGRLEP